VGGGRLRGGSLQVQEGKFQVSSVKNQVDALKLMAAYMDLKDGDKD
jgi:hypothetical protein